MNLRQTADDEAAGRRCQGNVANRALEGGGNELARQVGPVSGARERPDGFGKQVEIVGDVVDLAAAGNAVDDISRPRPSRLLALLVLPAVDHSYAHVIERPCRRGDHAVDAQCEEAALIGLHDRWVVALERRERRVDDLAQGIDAADRRARAIHPAGGDAVQPLHRQVRTARRLFQAGAAGQSVLQHVQDLEDLVAREAGCQRIADLIADLLERRDDILLDVLDVQQVPAERAFQRLADAAGRQPEHRTGQFARQIALDDKAERRRRQARDRLGHGGEALAAGDPVGRLARACRVQE